MCLGRTGVIVDVVREGLVIVEDDEGQRAEVSTAVLFAEGIACGVGDVVFVSMGLALRLEAAAGIEVRGR